MQCHDCITNEWLTESTQSEETFLVLGCAAEWGDCIGTVVFLDQGL